MPPDLHLQNCSLPAELTLHSIRLLPARLLDSEDATLTAQPGSPLCDRQGTEYVCTLEMPVAGVVSGHH